MRNLLTSTTSFRNVVCILDLLETIAPDLQRITHRTYAIQPIVQLTTSLQFFGNWQLSARVRRCPWPFKIIRVARCIGAVSKRYGFLFSTSSRRKATPSPVKFFFFFFFSSLLTFYVYYRAHPGSEFVLANTLAKWKKLEPNEVNFSQG